MKIFKWFLIIIVMIVLLVLAYLKYMGMFDTLKVSENQMGPFTIVYEKYVGPYQNTGKVFNDLNQALTKEGIKPTRGLGIYYDDPQKVSADKLRSTCGAIIEGENSAKLEQIKKKFQVMVIPKKNYIVTTFPLRNMVSMMIGPMKAYPAIMQYEKTKGYKMGIAVEVYDMPEKTIYFLMEINK